MSGTSLDGVDAVLADCAHTPPKSLAHAYRAFPVELRKSLTSLCSPGTDEIERGSIAARDLAHLYAAIVDDVLHGAGLAPSEVRAIGAHGQTVRHRPQLGFSVQLNSPSLLAELSSIDVVADFRSRDIAAGGHGAPLASLFHIAAFSGPLPRAVVNVGGISNLTGLPKRGEEGSVIGFDIGPGNLLLDHWAQKHFGLPFDRDGAIAASAQVDQDLLTALLAEPFFAQPPPKSSGRELFSPAWLEQVLRHQGPDPATVLTTLTCLSAVAIGSAIDDLVSASKRCRHLRGRCAQCNFASHAGDRVRTAHRDRKFSARCRARSGGGAGVCLARARACQRSSRQCANGDRRARTQGSRGALSSAFPQRLMPTKRRPKAPSGVHATSYAENDEPQPHVVVAFGFLITNCAPSKSSL